jgi:hypothetical protein
MTLRTSALLGLFALVALAGLPPGAQAEADARATDLSPGGPGPEALDTTRLHVDRLPPEAATVTRELYDQGLFLEAQLGALAFAGDAREVSHAGPRLAISLGYEFTRWFALLAQVESSLHQTNNRPPPSHTAYQLAGGVVGARFSVPIDERFAIWAAGLVGFVWSSGDVLRALGFLDAFNVGLNYGGELGFDWHMRSRHHSLGLLGGARHFPSLARDTFTVGAYGAAYVRYVF